MARLALRLERAGIRVLRALFLSLVLVIEAGDLFGVSERCWRACGWAMIGASFSAAMAALFSGFEGLLLA